MLHRRTSGIWLKCAVAFLLVGAVLPGTAIRGSAQAPLTDDLALPTRPTTSVPHPDPPVVNGDPSPVPENPNARYLTPDQKETLRLAYEDSKQAHNLIQQAFIDKDLGAIAWVAFVGTALLSCVIMLIRQKLYERSRKSIANKDKELKYEYLDKDP